MSLLDSAIKSFSPSWALKRQIAQNRLTRLQTYREKRSWEAVAGGRTRSEFLTTSKNADSFISGGAKTLRQHIRSLEFNNGFVSGPIQRIVNNVVGNGMTFQSRVKADEAYLRGLPLRITDADAELFNFLAEKNFKRWAKEADIRLILKFNDMARLIEAALVRDGEALVIGRTSARQNRFLPYCLELLEIDRLGVPMEEMKNPKLIDGILYDAEGVPESYFVLKEHPGEVRKMTGRKLYDFEIIPAFNPNGTRKVFHLFNPIRPEQSRGFSALAAGLKDFQDLDRYREAEVMASLEDACLTGFVKSPQPDAYQAGRTVDDTQTTDGAGSTQRIHEFGAGQWIYGLPGEEVEIHRNARPNTQMEAFINQLLRGPANALDIPPEVLAQNWQGMNYSNARTVLLQFYVAMQVRQNYLINYFYQPVWESALAALVANGHMGETGAAIYGMRKEDALQSVWIPPGWSWVDPTKEALGKEIEVMNGFDTHYAVAASKGMDAEENLDAEARYLKKKKDLEEKYDIKFPTKEQKPPVGNPDGENDDEEKPKNKKTLRIVNHD